jgi:PBP1b-binding outer membrane lipoprotein LpoB
MGVLKYSTMWLVVLFIQGCSSGEPAPPAPHAKTVFDPLTQPLDRARDVQKTVDHGADAVRKAVDSQERGDTSP